LYREKSWDYFINMFFFKMELFQKI